MFSEILNSQIESPRLKACKVAIKVMAGGKLAKASSVNYTAQDHNEISSKYLKLV